MSEPKRAALLLPHVRPQTEAEKETFAAQQLACQLYAGNHDMGIVGLCDLLDDADERPGIPASPGDPELHVVQPGGYDVVLVIDPAPQDDATGSRFAEVLERLRAEQIDVVHIDRREM